MSHHESSHYSKNMTKLNPLTLRVLRGGGPLDPSDDFLLLFSIRLRMKVCRPHVNFFILRWFHMLQDIFKKIFGFTHFLGNYPYFGPQPEISNFVIKSANILLFAPFLDWKSKIWYKFVLYTKNNDGLSNFGKIRILPIFHFHFWGVFGARLIMKHILVTAQDFHLGWK